VANFYWELVLSGYCIVFRKYVNGKLSFLLLINEVIEMYILTAGLFVCVHRLGVKPNCYVSYQTANNPWTYTEIVESSNDPVWCHENDCRFSTDLLKPDSSVCCICKVMSYS